MLKNLYRILTTNLIIILGASTTISCFGNTTTTGEFKLPTVTELNGYTGGSTKPLLDKRSLERQLDPNSSVGASWRQKIMAKLPQKYDNKQEEFVKSVENIGYLKDVVRNPEITSYLNLTRPTPLFSDWTQLKTWLKPPKYPRSGIELDDIATAIGKGIEEEYPSLKPQQAETKAENGLVKFYTILVHMVKPSIVQNLVSKLVVKDPSGSTIGGTILDTLTRTQYIEFYGDRFGSYTTLSNPQYQSGFWSSNSPFHVFIHEYGHALQNYCWLTNSARTALNNDAGVGPLYVRTLSGNDYLPIFLTNNFFGEAETIVKSQVTQQGPQLITYAIVPSGYARIGKYKSQPTDSGYFAESFAESFAYWLAPYMEALISPDGPTAQNIKEKASVNWALINSFYNRNYGGPSLKKTQPLLTKFEVPVS